jgi:hypothetical protein
MDQPFQFWETVYYSAVFVVGFLSGISQTLRDRTALGVSHCINVGLCSGFLSFAVVAVADGDNSARDGHEFFFLGVAAIIGLSGKFQEQILQSIWAKIASVLGIPVDDQKKKSTEEKTSDG